MIYPQQRFLKFVDVKSDDECWHWIGVKDTCGYGKFSLKGKRVGSHRFSFELFNKQSIPPKQVVMHTCDNPSCVNPKHLKLGSYSENAIDMVKKNRSRICFLNDSQAKEIRYSDLPIKDLAKKFEVSASCIRDIKKNRTWKHID